MRCVVAVLMLGMLLSVLSTAEANHGSYTLTSDKVGPYTYGSAESVRFTIGYQGDDAYYTYIDDPVEIWIDTPQGTPIRRAHATGPSDASTTQQAPYTLWMQMRVDEDDTRDGGLTLRAHFTSSKVMGGTSNTRDDRTIDVSMAAMAVRPSGQTVSETPADEDRPTAQMAPAIWIAGGAAGALVLVAAYVAGRRHGRR